jgi:hypothetical protein
MEKYIIRHRDGKTSVLDAKTKEPVSRMITGITVRIDAPGDTAKAVVECLDMGLNAGFAAKDIDFNEGINLVLDHEKRTHVAAALKAARAVVEGGDGRAAMLAVAEACNAKNVPIPTRAQLDRLVSEIWKPAKQDVPEDEGPYTDPVVEERISPATEPAVQAPPLSGDSDDPLMGAAKPV